MTRNEWDEWKEKALAKQREKLPKAPPPKPKGQKEPVSTRAITADELAKLKRMRKVSLAWWCQDGRFLQQFGAATEETQLTERQAWYIKVLWYKYRRQLKHNGPKPEGYRGR